jgi:hypothetical protein
MRLKPKMILTNGNNYSMFRFLLHLLHSYYIYIYIYICIWRLIQKSRVLNIRPNMLRSSIAKKLGVILFISIAIVHTYLRQRNSPCQLHIFINAIHLDKLLILSQVYFTHISHYSWQPHWILHVRTTKQNILVKRTHQE